MKRRRTIGLVLVFLLIIAAAVIWSRPGQPARWELASTFAKSDLAAVQVERFDRAWELSRPNFELPPAWLQPYRPLALIWSRLHQQTERVYPGLVWVLVDASVTTNQPLQTGDIEYRLDYGAYTMGTSSTGLLTDTGHPYKIDTRLTIPADRVPQALEIRVKSEWFRFPVTVP